MAARNRTSTRKTGARKSGARKTGARKSTRSRALAGGKATKNPRQYKALRRKGVSKQSAARITNAGKSASKRGGRKSAGGARSRTKK